MNTGNHFPLVEVTRGSIVESVHFGSLAVAQPGGEVLLSLGDMVSPFYLRSTAKPFQALAFLERGGAEFYGLEPREVALLCASHSGTDEHVRLLEKMQQKIGIQESMLQCGVHPPLHAEKSHSVTPRTEEPHPNQHECSGKHTGMLAYAKMISAPLDSYLEPSHPVQQSILQVFAEMCSCEVEDIPLGTDGCSAPVFAVPLPNAAAAYARLCQPDGLTAARAAACRVITAAMADHPDLVAGPHRFDTDVMTAARGSLVTKIGAEGYQGIGILTGKSDRFSSSLGIAIKISDGDLTLRAGCVVALAILKKLGVFNPEQIESLKDYDRREIKNWRGKVVGEIRPSAGLLQTLSHWDA
jgi:L-asparaginase II